MKKKLVLFVLCLLCKEILSAQGDERTVTNPGRLPNLEISLDAKEKVSAAVKFPFQSFKIVDSRFDTGKIGFIPRFTLSKKKAYKKAVLKAGTANAISTYLNDYYADAFTQNGFELLIVIKRLWFSGIDNTRAGRAEIASSLKTYANVYCKWEFYLGKDGSYFPIKRTDTIFHYNQFENSFTEERFSESDYYYIKSVLKTMTESPDYNFYLPLFNSKPKKSIEEINAYNEKRYNLPVLKDVRLLKGVYLSFEEFKNNKPSIPDFKERKMNYGLLKKEQYLETSAGDLISDYWGYSDGEYFRYGKYGNDKIYREGNTFEFFVQVVDLDFDGRSTPVITKQTTRRWVPYQLDMETGEIY